MIATSISEVIEQLNGIVEQSILKSDRCGYFAALYKRVTVTVANKIREGYFDDNARMEKLDVVFANRYLEAHENYFAGKPCSASWSLAFDACRSWRPMVIHHLFAGMSAHISLDLGIAAATVSPGNDINSVQNDFNKINTILSGLTSEVKAELYAMWPLSKVLARMHTDKLENDIAGFSMEVARDAAWQVALAYAPLNTSSVQETYITERDKSVEAFSKKLLYPGAWISTVMRIFRIFEFGSISGKIRKLDRIVI